MLKLHQKKFKKWEGSYFSNRVAIFGHDRVVSNG